MKQDYIDLADYLASGQFNQQNTSSIFYRGLGQMGALLLDPDHPENWPKYQQKLQPIVSQIHALARERYQGEAEQVLAQLKKASLSSYFTPTELIGAITKSLDFGKIKRVLDPSAGTGNFLSYIPTSSQVTALEPNLISFEILQQLYPEAITQNCGLEEAKLDNYDLIISNIPFGSFRVFDKAFLDSGDPVRIASTTRIHNYFFLKAADHLNDDGLLVFITSAGFSDSPSNASIRKKLVDSCVFRAAVRLPGEVFSDAGTKPTTDLLIFQKRSGQAMSANDQLFVNSFQKLTPKGPLNQNCFFKANPQYMIGEPIQKGQHSNVQFALTSDLSLNEIADQLGELISMQLAKPINQVASNKPLEFDHDELVKQRIEDSEINHRLEPGNLLVYKGKVSVLQKDHKGYYLTPADNIKSPDRVNRLNEIRFTYFELIEAEQEDGKDIKELRTQLNQQYDAYAFQYGKLNEKETLKILEQDVQAHALLGLEIEKDGSCHKAEIFHKRIHNAELEEVTVQTLADAIVVSLNRFNRIHLGYLSQTLDKPQHEIIREAIKEDLLYLDCVDANWRLVTKDQFLSGDVYKKLDDIDQSFPEPYKDLKDLHLSMVAEIVPPIVPFKLIDINLGEPWIDLNVYNEFLKDFFKADAHVVYFGSLDKFKVVTDNDNTVSKIDYAIKGVTTKITGKELMQHAFSDTSPYITYLDKSTSADGVRVIDTKAIRAAQDKIELIKQNFQDWISNHTEWHDFLERQYNRKFNQSVPRVYDGSHLQFKDLQIFKPYQTQRNAVYRNLQQNGGINDHIVGAGKTLVMAITAYEMKRLGVARKPLIIAKNANVGAIYKEFKKAYPFSKVLHPTERDFIPKRRKLLFQKMMNNHWDVVILSHEQFKAIPQSLAIQRDILLDEIKALQADLDALKEDEAVSLRELKGLETRKENMTARLNMVNSLIKRDVQIADFDKMGFDHLFVDESQEFKNLLYTTRHRNISGLGNPKGSQRAFNLLLACRTIQKKLGNVDKGITFLSGTTISNSLVELYLLFKYLRPNALKKLNIKSFDSWAKVYARKTYDFEFGITNEIKRKERYRQFIKLPELAMFYTEIADVVNHKNFKEDKPKVVNKMVSLTPTPDQTAYMQSLVNFAKTQNGSHIGKPFMTQKEKQAYMLIATNLAKQMSLDMRLIGSQYNFTEGCKLDVAAKTINTVYQETTSFKGTQLVFCDMSTPSQGWNAYDALKDLLVSRHGIPSEQIVFIHHYTTTKQRLELYRLVNAGIIRILIGSTIKMGVGVNVQERVVAMHHLDIPWRPSDMTQRTGRGGRPGNIMAKLHRGNEVHNYIYATEKSLDPYQFNILSNKQLFIDQIKDNSIKSRRIDEGAMETDGAEQTMNFAEYVAILSGNQTLLEKVKIDKQMKDLQLQYENHETQKRDAQKSILYANWKIEDLDKTINAMADDIAIREKFESDPDNILKPEKRYYYPKPIVYRNRKFYDSRDFGIHLLEIYSESASTYRASYGPFTISTEGVFNKLIIYTANGISYSSGSGRPSGQAAMAGQYIRRALRSIESSIEACELEKTKLIESKAAYEKRASKPFPKLDQMAFLKEECKRLEREIEDNAMEKTNEQVSAA